LPTDYTAAVPTFGENLRAERKAQRMSQTELARRLGHANNSTISKWETEAVLPEPETIKLVAKALNELPPGRLLVGVPTPWDALRFGADLVRQSPGTASAPHQGRADVPASAQARIHELATENEDLKNRIAAVEEAAARIFTIIADYKDRRVTESKTRRGRRRRKTG